MRYVGELKTCPKCKKKDTYKKEFVAASKDLDFIYMIYLCASCGLAKLYRFKVVRNFSDKEALPEIIGESPVMDTFEVKT